MKSPHACIPTQLLSDSRSTLHQRWNRICSGEMSCPSRIAASEAMLNDEGAIPSTERTAQLLPAISYGSNEVEALFPTPLARMPRYNSILIEFIKERVIPRVLAKSWLVKYASEFSPRGSNCGCWVYKRVVTVFGKGWDTSVCSHSLAKL